MTGSFASSTDTAGRFSQNQALWLKHSETVIRDFLSRLNTFENFAHLYWELAQKRAEIARELKHGDKNKRTQDYGTPRPESQTAFEVFKSNDSTQAWVGQKDKVFALANQLILTINDISPEAAGFRENDDIVVFPFDNEAVFRVYNIQIKSPHKDQKVNEKNHSQKLSKITIQKDNFDNRNNAIMVEYIDINKCNIEGDFNLANEYYQNILAWKADKGIPELLMWLGRLAHLMAHLLPVKLGNAAINEWVFRGLAFHQGLKLGTFNHDEGISWDFMALFTPNRETYAQWFATQCFTHYTNLSPDEALSEFCFDSQETLKRPEAPRSSIPS